MSLEEKRCECVRKGNGEQRGCCEVDTGMGVFELEAGHPKEGQGSVKDEKTAKEEKQEDPKTKLVL